MISLVNGEASAERERCDQRIGLTANWHQRARPSEGQEEILADRGAQARQNTSHGNEVRG